MCRRCVSLFVTFASFYVVYGRDPRETSAFASHCEGTVCNLVLGIKNIPQKNHTTSPKTTDQQLLPVLHLLDGITNVIKRNKQRTQQKFSTHDKQIREVVRAVGLIANNTRRYQTQVREKFVALEKQFNALHLLVGGASSSGVITRGPEEKLDLSTVVATDCAALYLAGVNVSGVYLLQPDPSDNRTRFRALCDMDTEGGGWTVIQRRHYGSEDFFRGWKSYTEGFGDLEHDFWLGLRNIHRLTKFGNNKMRFDLQDWGNKSRESTFDFVRISDESDKFRILAGGYHGNAGDPFHTPNMDDRMQSMRFSTYDNDNDMNSRTSCARTFSSGWWFNNCFLVNPNGIWYPSPTYGGKIPNGIIWNFWHPNGYSLKSIEIKLRPELF